MTIKRRGFLHGLFAAALAPVIPVAAAVPVASNRDPLKALLKDFGGDVVYSNTTKNDLGVGRGFTRPFFIYDNDVASCYGLRLEPHG